MPTANDNPYDLTAQFRAIKAVFLRHDLHKMYPEIYHRITETDASSAELLRCYMRLANLAEQAHDRWPTKEKDIKAILQEAYHHYDRLNGIEELCKTPVIDRKPLVPEPPSK